MRVLVGCEFSQTVTKAFRDRGHEAFSCDFLPTEGNPDWHYQCDVMDVVDKNWDLAIFHPSCQFLSNAGIRWFNEERYGDKARDRKEKRLESMDFVKKLFELPIPKIAIENPVGYLNGHWRKPDQIIQPYMFGDTESKRTCLWLKNLPKLKPTNIVKPKIYAYYKNGNKKGQPIYGTSYMHFSEDRWKERSRFFNGISEAMAEQWES